MHSTDWRTWPDAATTAACSYGPATLVGQAPRERLLADQRARWLFRDAAYVPTLDDMASVFGLSFEAPGPDDASAVSPRRLALTLAVLRDVFPDDVAARRWLRSADEERGGVRPLDLLLDGRVEELEALVVRQWNLGARDA